MGVQFKWRFNLSNTPFWVTFHFEWHFIFSDIPFWATFHFEWHSIFNYIPFEWQSILNDISFFMTFHFESEFLVTPKFGVLLRIRSNWAKHSEFTPQFRAPRPKHHFCSLNGWKIFSRSWDTTKWRCLQKTLSARTNFVQNVVQNYRGHNLI